MSEGDGADRNEEALDARFSQFLRRMETWKAKPEPMRMVAEAEDILAGLVALLEAVDVKPLTSYLFTQTPPPTRSASGVGARRAGGHLAGRDCEAWTDWIPQVTPRLGVSAPGAGAGGGRAAVGRCEEVSSGEVQTRLYRVWAEMKSACANPWARSFRWHGARGVAVCADWQASPAFLGAGFGYRDGLTLDRVDAAGDYGPGNCVWVPRLRLAGRDRHGRFVAGD